MVSPPAECKSPGLLVPVIDRNRCEAKGPCVDVCPYDVFGVLPIGPAEKATMSVFGRVKAWAHGNRQAFVVRADQCHACGLCVAACPEKAIKLAPVRSGQAAD